MQSSNAPSRYLLRKRKDPLPKPAELAPDVKVPRTEQESSDETSTTHIDNLPDELLGYVIRALGPRDRLFSESVCHRWDRVSHAYGWLDFHLNANDLHTECSHTYDAQIAEVVEKKLKCIFSRCAPTVREIDFSGLNQYGVDGRICELLTSEMTKLETLNLEHIRLDIAQLAAVGKHLPWLKSISLGGCFREKRAAEGVKALTSLLNVCRHLESLNLRWSGILGYPNAFSSLPATLRRLDISNCAKIHPSIVDHLLATCAGNLRELGMEWVGLKGWTNQQLERLFTGLKNLEELHFWQCLNQEEEARDRLECLGALKNLRRLELGFNKSATSEALTQIVAGCQELESLVLYSFTKAVSDADVGRLAQLPKLTRLQLWQHPSINDEALAELAKGPARLRELSVYGCGKVTDNGISYLLEGCGGQLRELNVAFCPLVTHATLLKLEALYNDSKGDIEKGRIFVLRADALNLGFSHKEFGASRRIE